MVSSTTKRRTDKLIVEVCDSVGQFIAWWGFKAIHGRVWTMLALSTYDLTQAELARRLGVSPALMSSTMRELQGFGLVRQVEVNQGRGMAWQAVMDVWPVIGDVLRNREWVMVETAHRSLEAALEEVELAQGEGELDYDPGRLRVLLALTETAQAMLQMLVSLRVPRQAEHLGEALVKASALLRALRGLS
jgi:DNA-binding transcriptional regulator GbsR (MarR family)